MGKYADIGDVVNMPLSPTLFFPESFLCNMKKTV
jgi:hypothetical protein